MFRPPFGPLLKFFNGCNCQLILSCGGVAAEVFATLVDFDKITKVPREVFPLVSIGASGMGLVVSGISYWCVGNLEGARCRCLGKCIPSFYTDEEEPHCWGSAFHMLGLLFWVAHFVLAVLDYLGERIHRHFYLGRLSVYPGILAIAELVHSLISLSSCFDRRYYIVSMDGRGSVAHTIEGGYVLIKCPACERAIAASASTTASASASVWTSVSFLIYLYILE